MSNHPEPPGTKPATASPTRTGRVTGIGLTDAARDQAAGYIERRKSEMARFIAELARALRGGSASRDGRSHGTSGTKPFVEGVASSLDALSVTIDERGVGDLYRDVETAARRHPAAALLVALAAVLGVFHLLRARPARAGSNPNSPGL